MTDKTKNTDLDSIAFLPSRLDSTPTCCSIVTLQATFGPVASEEEEEDEDETIETNR